VTYLDILIALRDMDGLEAELEIREAVGNTNKMSLASAMKKPVIRLSQVKRRNWWFELPDSITDSPSKKLFF